MRVAVGRLHGSICVGLGAAVAVLFLVSAASASAITVRNGHYAGRGRPVTAGVPAWADLSFDVSGGVVQNGFWAGNGTGGCSYAANFTNSSPPDVNGRFELDYNYGDTAGTLKGRFVSPTEVRGRLIFTDTTSCPQTQTKFNIDLARFGTKAPSGGSSTVRDGHYAGAGKDFDVWFDLKNRRLQNTTYVSMSEDGCSTTTGDFSTPKVNSKGRFKTTASDSNFDFTLTGRFFSPTALAGGMTWQINSFCTPGTFTFSYTGKKFDIPG